MSERKIYGLLAEFDNVEDLIDGARDVRAAGYKKWDAHTPFPVHGLDDAMGVEASKLPFLVLLAGMAGVAAGLGLQWFTNAFDYKLVISGKPFFGIPANIPITFEITVLLSALTAFVGMLVFNNLPMWYHSLFNSERFRRVTNDRFFISVEARDPLFELGETKKLLESLQGATVEEVEE